ncbi:MAG: Na/Pi cotransporter family protein [Paludibacteraceae bacterium]|nr:Na/Pi cotransporter family protein [Paludibacteraceae bacterium]
MSFGIVEILTLIGAVGLFLYGMKLMSEGIQKAAGDRLRKILSLMTNNRWMGALTGILVTVLVQSSSATTVMIVSFVNAGLLSLGQSMAVIMGANIGTTATAWIISLFGFKVNIASFAVPLMAFAVPLIFSGKNQWKNWGEFLLGFALLFMGLEYLNNSVPDLQSNPEVFAGLQRYSDLGFWSILIFVLVGVVLTLIVQASSATFAIALIMCSKGWIPFDCTCGIVLGANIGTCITPILASVSGNVWAKRAAMGHLMFNVLGLLWTLPLFYPLVALIKLMSNNMVGDPDELIAITSSLDHQTLNALNNGLLDKAEYGDLISRFAAAQVTVSFALALFHTVYKSVNFLIMIWFTKLYEKIVVMLVPTRKADKTSDEKTHLNYISSGIMSTAELSILQAQKEIQSYGERTNRMFGMVRDMFHTNDENKFTEIFSRIQKYENISDRMEVEIAEYLGKVIDGRLSNDTKRQIQIKLRVVSEVESVADSCYNIARTLQRYRNQHEKYTKDQENNIELMFNLVQNAMEHMLLVLNREHIIDEDSNKAADNENEINNFRNQLKNQNIESLNNNEYTYQTSVTYMDTIVECEKMGDYIVNVVEAIADAKFH